MGDIVRPSFGNRSPVATEKPDRDAPVVELSEGVADVATLKLLADDTFYVRENKERVTEGCQRGDEITDFIFSMANFRKKDESVELRQGQFALTSLEDLCGYLLDTNQFQWRSKPHYFGAIILEMNKRLEVARKVLGDEKVPKFRE